MIHWPRQWGSPHRTAAPALNQTPCFNTYVESTQMEKMFQKYRYQWYQRLESQHENIWKPYSSIFQYSHIDNLTYHIPLKDKRLFFTPSQRLLVEQTKDTETSGMLGDVTGSWQRLNAIARIPDSPHLLGSNLRSKILELVQHVFVKMLWNCHWRGVNHMVNLIFRHPHAPCWSNGQWQLLSLFYLQRAYCTISWNLSGRRSSPLIFRCL